jgi:glycine betaine/choline ABC-type transport system substrate-binding protein
MANETVHHHVQFIDVTYKVHRRILVSHLNFRIGKGETLVLLGRSGSGKTTTMKLINHLLMPTHGEVLVEEKSTTDTFAIIVRGEDAQKLNLQKISQLTDYDAEFQPAFSYEFFERPDGYPGFSKKYGLEFAKRPKMMQLGLMYRALAFNQVDLIVANSTDGLIKKLDLFILEDDRQYFPPYEAVPIVRQETLANYPQVKEAIGQLSGVITSQDMQAMNYQVDGEFRKIPEVVQEFLQSKGLI